MALSWAEFGAAIDEQGIPISDYVAQGEAYWHGRAAAASHPAGYDNWDATNYTRTEYGRFADESAARIEPGELDAPPVPFYHDLAALLSGRFNINQTFVEVGCGPGALIYYARQQGIEAYGVEVSQYAVDYGELLFPGVSQWITVQDAYSWMTAQKPNSVDILISRNFICCLDDTQTDIPEKWIANFVDQQNRIARTKLHMILPVPAEYYIAKSKEEWRDSYDWDVGTYFVDGNDFSWVRK